MIKNFFYSIKLVLRRVFFKIKNENTASIIGYILLIPPLFGILSFIINIVFLSYIEHSTVIFGNYYTEFFWWGSKNRPSQFPLYFGLMALAGAYLIKNDDVKKD